MVSWERLWLYQCMVALKNESQSKARLKVLQSASRPCLAGSLFSVALFGVLAFDESSQVCHLCSPVSF